MNHLTGKFVFFLIIVIFLSGFAGNLQAQAKSTQTEDEIEVPILQKIGSRDFNCHIESGFFDEARFKYLTSYKDCKFPNLETFKPDFKTRTIIGFSAFGDCRVSASARVSLNEKAKKYAVKIRSIGGGCQTSGGRFQGWLAIKKIPPGYDTEFSEITGTGGADNNSDKGDYQADAADSLIIEKAPAPRREKLETIPYEMKDCLPLYRTPQAIFNTEEDLKKAVRNDFGRERCLKDLKEIDFSKHTLIGTEINSGYCGVPIGLRYGTTKDPAKKNYIMNISYLAPGEPCRALSRYDIWLLVPKLPGDYRLNFEIESIREIRRN